jgi:hypothetical protein
VFQSCQSEVSSLAQILLGQLLTLYLIGVPVAVTTLPGFLARGIVAAFAGERKGGYLVKPGKPGRTLRNNPEYLAVTRLVEFVGLCRGRSGQCKRGDFRHRIYLMNPPMTCSSKIFLPYNVLLNPVYLLSKNTASDRQMLIRRR